MIEIIKASSVDEGTNITRETLMAMQGFIGVRVVFNEDGSITETNSKGQTMTTTFNEDGSITETFVGQKTIVKKIYFRDNVVEEIIE